MPQLTPADPAFESRIRAGFARQQLMAQLNATLAHVAPGEVHLAMPFSPAWTQQDGFIHAGIITALVDSACGFAAHTLMPSGTGVLTVEYKVNFLNAAQGDRFVAIGRVVKAGRTLTVCRGDAIAFAGNEKKLVAAMQATMMAIR
jgi:uncharacterized protein (TIGR00369 family)